MSDVPERPVLRIVQPDEVHPEPVVEPAPPLPTVQVAPQVISPPSKESTAFTKCVSTVDAAIPLNAAHLVCTGCYLADQALAFHHQAVASAPPDTFRHDTPPGLKSAQATREWLDTHLSALKKKSTEVDAATAPYARSKDLRQAVELAGSELDRALDATKTAGLKFEERAADLFTASVKNLTSTAVTTAVTPSSEVVAKTIPSSATDMYLIGCDILASVV